MVTGYKSYQNSLNPSAQLFMTYDHDVFTISLIRNPCLVRNQGFIIKPRYFYSR